MRQLEIDPNDGVDNAAEKIKEYTKEFETFGSKSIRAKCFILGHKWILNDDESVEYCYRCLECKDNE